MRKTTAPTPDEERRARLARPPKRLAERRTVQMRELDDLALRRCRLSVPTRADFRRRRVHPTIEALVWGHVVGKPTERVQLSADVAMTQTLEKERELFSRLTLQQMEELAAESQALVDKVTAMARANSVTPVPATVGASTWRRPTRVARRTPATPPRSPAAGTVLPI